MIHMSRLIKTSPPLNPLVPGNGDTALLEKQAEKVKVPALYKVLTRIMKLLPESCYKFI